METVVLNISIIRARTALVTHTVDSSDIVVIDVKVSEGMPAGPYTLDAAAFPRPTAAAIAGIKVMGAFPLRANEDARGGKR